MSGNCAGGKVASVGELWQQLPNGRQRAQRARAAHVTRLFIHNVANLANTTESLWC